MLVLWKIGRRNGIKQETFIYSFPLLDSHHNTKSPVDRIQRIEGKPNRTFIEKSRVGFKQSIWKTNALSSLKGKKKSGI